MNFELSDDQVALRDAARDLLDDLASPARVRAHLATDAPYDAVLWKAVVEQGWMAIAVPEAQGGLGLGPVELAVVLEEVGSHAAPIPFAESVLAARALSSAGDEGAPWLTRLLDGSAIGCVASGAGPVVGAPVADVCVVVGDGDAVELIDLTGAQPAREPAMDVTRALGWVARESSTPLPGVDVATVIDTAAVVTSALLLGGAVRVLDMAVAYAKDRVQFGKPIGSFQAVKHRCADMLVDVEGMRSTVYYAAWSLGAGEDASVAASTAKVWCGDAGPRVMASALQVHGGIGFTWEHDLHLFLKRAQLDALSYGDATYHRARLGRLLRTRVESGGSVL